MGRSGLFGLMGAAWVVLGAVTSAPVQAQRADPAATPPAAPDALAFPDELSLRLLAERDIAQARPVLRRAARTADAAATRTAGLRLIAQHDVSTATARICARALRLDPDLMVRRTAAECLGRQGARIGAAHTASLVAALADPALDVMTMSGWALANVGDASAVEALVARADHPDPRVARLFRGYALRLRDRLGLVPASPLAQEPAADTVRAIPPGVALTTTLQGLDGAVAAGWLGTWGALSGWAMGPLLLSAHGGQSVAGAGALGGLTLGAVGAASMAGYSYALADTLPLAHTVVQMGTLGVMAGYGAGQLVGTAPISGVAATNLASAGLLAGAGLGMALVEVGAPSVGALGAGMLAAGTTMVSGGVLAGTFGYPFDQGLGVGLLGGGVAGALTTVALSGHDIGMFPLAGAALGAGVLGAGGMAIAGVVDGAGTDATGWLTLLGTAAGLGLGGIGGALLPPELDPLLEGNLRLSPPTVAFLPGAGLRPEAIPMAMVQGTF